MILQTERTPNRGFQRRNLAITGTLLLLFATGNALAYLDPPTLFAPANRDTTQPTTPQLRWSAVVFAHSYDLQIAIDSTFSLIRLDTTTSAMPSPTIVVGPLGYDSTYYWRVRTRDSSGSFGLWSTSWRFKTLRPTPAIPQLVSPANNATNILLSDSLLWNAVAFADAYEVQISTSSTFATVIVDTTVPLESGNPRQGTPLPSLNNKTAYYWRVRSINAAGASAWSSGWKFTTIVPVPTLPVLTAPADGARSLPTNPTLSWGAVTDAASYRLQISADSTFATSTYDDSSITTTSRQVTGLGYNSRFYWRVRAKNIAGIGPFSTLRRFSTQLPQAPLVSPANASTGVPVAPTLDWGSVAGAVSYRVQVSTATSFTPLLLNSTTTDDQVPAGPLLNNTRYYWRVSAVGASGDTSTYPTTAWNFTTIVDTPTVPFLLTPADHAMSLPTNPTLSWADTGGTSFTLQVSQDPGFTTLAYNDSTLTTKSKQVTGLSYNTTYYWRVSAKNAAARTPYSAPRKFSTQLAQPALVSPPNNGTGQSISTVLDWQAVSGAVAYRLQVSTSTTFSPALVNTTTPSDEYPLSSLANGTKYYWRVSALNAAGDTSAYPTTAWNFTTIVDTPAVPALLTPAQAAHSAPLNLTFTWESTGGTSYRLQVALDENFTSLVVNDSSITTKSKAISGLLNNTRYYWRVNAKNLAATSMFSAVRFFTTQLPAVQPLAPFSGAVDQEVNARLTWQTVPGAVSYAVQVSPTQSPFSPTVLNATTAGDYVETSGLQFNTRYYWRVSARNADGDTSVYPATPWNFKTKIPAPVLGSPANGASGLPINPTLAWNSSAGASLYRLQVSIDPTFQGGGLLDDSTISNTVTSRQIGPLDNSRTYFWRVRATDNVSPSTSAWSTVWSFTTKVDTPAVPALLSPADMSTDLPINTTLSWAASAGAALYSVQIAYDSLFSQLVVDGPPTIGTSFPVGSLSNNTRYFWRVKAINTTGSASSPYSAPWSFTTIIALPAVPSPVAPTSGATNQPQFVTLKWRKANSASTYRLELATDSRFEGDPVIDSAGIVDTAVTVGALVNNAYYYWRVRSINALGMSAPSPVSSFSTVIAAPVLVAPLDDATNLNAPVTFQWNPVTGASSYRLQIAAEPTFATIVVDDSLIAGTSRPVSSLAVSKRYYWRVMAVSSTNGTALSSVWSFTTTIYQPDIPTLASPAHNATGQPVQIALRWYRTLGADSYRLQVATNPTFATGMVFDTPGLADTVQALTTLQYNATYYWRVMAFNDIGPSEYSPVWNFTTAVPPPATPMLALPLNGETGVQRPTTLIWRRAAGATSYTLKVSLVNRSVVEFRPNITDTSAVLSSLAPGIAYLWRVIAASTGGTDSSAEWTFTTIIDPPTSPVPVSPADGSINQPTTVALRWRSSPGATQYRLQVSPDPGFSTIVYNDSSITDTARLVGPLAGLTGYYWRVQARNTGGNSPFSPPWMLTTIISTPSARLPLDGAQHQSIAAVLVWSKVSGAAQYKVQVANDPLFNDLVHDGVTPVDTFQVINNLTGFRTYFWRVYAQNPGGSSTSPYSAVRYFTTMIDTPMAVAPSDGANGQPTNIRLVWRVTPYAQTYVVQVAGDPGFGVLFASQSGIGDTSVVLGPLPGQTRCYWRVKARNQADSSEYSTARSFTTTLSTPTLVAPISGALHQPIDLSLRWSTVIGGSRYRVQVARDTLFQQTVFDDSLLVGDSVRVGGLSNSIRYFWRVRAKSASGLDVSAFAAPWHFSTIIDTPSIPVHVTPAQAAVNQSGSLRIVWRAAPRAERYRLQIAADPSFLNPVLDDSTLADTTRQIGPLAGLTRYHWRVSASNTGGASPFSSPWNFTTVISTPSAIAPPSGSTDLPTAISFHWGSVAGAATYRLQVATDSLFAARVMDDSSIVDSFRTVQGLMNQKRYFWRVRAKNTAGTSIGGFSSPWNFTTIVDTPSVPTLVYPADNALNIPTTLRVRWRNADRASSYRLEFAADSIFSEIVLVDSALTDTSRMLPTLLNYQQYFWRVRATNIGGTSHFSPTFSFTTLLATPALAAPANGATDQAISMQFHWQAVPSASTYRLQVASDSTFKAIVHDDSLVTALYKTVPPLQNQMRYFWRVRAKAADGIAISAFTASWYYTTIVDTPTVPVLATPLDRAAGLSTTPTLRWRSAARATRYTLVLAADSLFSNVVVQDSLLTDTLRQVGPLTTLTRYWWRVYASNPGGTSPSSTAWSFFTIIATPVLASPADNSTMQPTALTITWQPSPGATSYRLQVSTDSLFGSAAVDDSTITATSRQLTGLSVYTTYYWRVRARNQRGIGEYSSPWRFTTIIVAPSATILAAPVNGAPAEPVVATLRWRPVPLAEKYIVTVSLDSPFDNPVFEDSTGTDTLMQVGPLQHLTRYYWRVKAKNSQGDGPFSPTWTFTTIIQPPTLPAPVAPASASGDQPFFVRLIWTSSARAERYHLQLSRDAAFDSLVVNDTTVADTSRQVGPLDHSHTYFWRVRAINASWSTPFTPTWSFTTLEPPTEYSLSQNYPNPFNPVTRITYQLPQETEVSLKVFNMLGQEVRTLVSGLQKPGRYEVELDAGDLPSGAYMYRLAASGWSSVKKLMVVR